MSVARERSLGKGVSQKLVGGDTRRLYKRSDVRCHFLETSRLFDGEARCCKSVGNHTTVTSARVAPSIRAAERAGIRTGKVAACLARMLTLLPLRLQHGLLPSCIWFPSTFGRSSFGCCGPAAFS